jgi:hypothetical protein
MSNTGRRETRQIVPDGPAAILLPSDEEEMTDATETEDGEEDQESIVETGASVTSESEDDDDEWIPPPEPTPKAVKTKGRLPQQKSSSYQVPNNQTTAKRSSRSQISKLAQDMDAMSLASDDSIILLPPRKPKAQQRDLTEDDDLEKEVPTIKKKRRYDLTVCNEREHQTDSKNRQLPKKTIVTEEEIEKVVEGRNTRARQPNYR